MSQRHHRIHLRRAASGHVCGSASDPYEEDADSRKSDRVGGADLERVGVGGQGSDVLALRLRVSPASIRPNSAVALSALRTSGSGMKPNRPAAINSVSSSISEPLAIDKCRK